MNLSVLSMNKFVKISALVLTFLATSTQLFSQWAIIRQDADSLVRLGLDNIYNVKFDKAEQYFDEVKDLYPEHPVGYFLDAMVDWWKLTLNKDDKRFNSSFLKKINRVIEKCDELLEENPKDINALFFKAGAIGYRGRFYANDESWVNAAKDGSEGFDLLVECSKIAPGNHDIMLGTGIYNYFADVLPQKYPVIKPLLLFLPSGDKKLGLLQLNASAKYALYAGLEAKVVLLQIYYSFENDIWKATEIIEDLIARYPDNPYFHRYQGRIYIRRGMNQQAELVWREVLKRCFAKQTGYERFTAREAMYYIGVALYERGDYEQALKYLYKCDEGSRSLDKSTISGFMVNANLYIGKILDIQGKRKYAVKQYEKLLKMKEYNNSHSEAERYLKAPYKK